MKKEVRLKQSHLFAQSLNHLSADDVDADELLARYDVLGGRKLFLADGRELGRRESACGAVAVERGDEGGRKVRHLVRADDSAVGDAEEFDVESVVLLQLVYRADELAQVFGDEALRGRCLLERAAVADEEDELAGRNVGGNLDGYALDELLARLRSDVGLNLDGLAAVDFVAVERDAVERGGAARVNGGDVERDGAEFDALEAARKKRLHGSGDRARGIDACARHREAAFERDRLLPLDLNLAAHADRGVAQRALARSDGAVDRHVQQKRRQELVRRYLVLVGLDLVAARVQVYLDGNHLGRVAEFAVDAGRAILRDRADHLARHGELE